MKLYARDSAGRVRVWWMEQEGNKYRTVSGLLDGQLVTSEWTVVQGKNSGKANATDGELQAKKEVAAKYKKQRKSGYFDNIADIDQQQYFEVMLAKNFGEYKAKIDWKRGVIVQIKFNGHRCVATKDGLRTRTGETYVSVPHISRDLEQFFKCYPDAVLDGELFNYELRQYLNEISKLVRKTVNITPEDLAASERLVRYYVYDGFGFGATQKDGYEARKAAIDGVLPQHTKYVKQVIDYVVHSQEELDKIYQTFLADEQEGAIIRLLDVPYENKRSKYLLKYKPVDDDEFIIVDIKEGSGNWAGTGKIISFRMPNGKEFDGTFKGSWEECAQFLREKDQWLGREVTVLYNGFTGLGTPNYARMDIHNCLKR